MAAPQVLTSDETLRLLAERAKEEDSFSVKVSRRTNQSMPLGIIATLSGATAGHFTNPELWLPQLCGGGKFQLLAYHISDLNKPVGGFISVVLDNVEPRDVDVSATSKSTWRGPTTIEFPQPQAQRQPDLGLIYNSPPAPGSGDSATSTNQVAWDRQAGGGPRRPNYSDAEPGRVKFEQSLAHVEAERRRLEEQKLELEREKHAAQLEGLKKAHEADLKALKMELLGAIQQSKPTGPDSSTTMLQALFTQAAEDRREAAKQAAEDRRAATALQAAADARFMTMMEKFSERKQENPLETIKTVSEILGKKGNDNEAQMKVMHSMSEMMQTISGVSMDFIQRAADMQLGANGDGESSTVKAIQEVVKGIGAMAKGSLRAKAMQPQFVPAQLPPPPPTYEQQALAQPPAQAAAPVPPPPPAAPPASVIQQVEDAIRKKFDVVQVAAALIKHFDDPSIQSALAEAGGDVETLFAKRLGNWHNESPENAKYLEVLFAEIEKQIGGDDEEEDAETTEADEGDDE